MKISQFQQLIAEKYLQRDAERGTPATFMWLIEEVGELATALAEDDKENLSGEFADVFAWLCTLANINGVDIERACVGKYSENSQEGYK